LNFTAVTDNITAYIIETSTPTAAHRLAVGKGVTDTVPLQVCERCRRHVVS